MPLTQVQPGMLGTPQPYNFKNRIINGGMTIDQRNAGASVTPSASTYTLDRWLANLTAASKFSVVQSSVAPAGFVNSVLITSTSAYSIVAGDYNAFQQRIEANNMSDAGWGSSNAQTFTLSFWVRSSLTGTFGGSLYFPATTTRTFPFSYTISAANTWEQKSITIAGDTTSNTASTGNGLYVIVQWALGAGSTYTTATAGWQNGNFACPTGSTNLIATNGANLYLTGVQLEVGVTATSFDFRSIGTELSLCKRYYEVFNNSSIGVSFVASLNTGTQNGINPTYTTKRAVPTFGLVAGSSYATGTPTIFSLGVDNSYIYLTTGWWYITGPVNTPSCFFSAEL